MVRSRLCTVVVIATVAATFGSSILQARQTQGPTMPPAAVSAEEAAAVAQIWAVLAAGRVQEVGDRARQLLDRFPRSAVALATAVEAGIAAQGALSALSTYESWLGARTSEEPQVVRRIARAVLYEWARQNSQSGVRMEALVILAQDGDPQASSIVTELFASGSEGGLRAAARMQDPQAIARITARLKEPGSRKLTDIEVLAESGSPLAVPGLMDLLSDAEPAVRANAADALGRIANPAALSALQGLLKDPNGVVRTAAAGALFELGDYSGASILEAHATHESSSVRRTAARLMASRPDEVWLTLVRSLLYDANPETRLDAAVLLEPHDPAAARAAIESLAADPNLAIREDAEIRRTELGSTTVAELRGLLRFGRPLARIRAAGAILARTR